MAYLRTDQHSLNNRWYPQLRPDHSKGHSGLEELEQLHKLKQIGAIILKQKLAFGKEGR